MAAYATVAQFRLLAPSAQSFVNTSDAVIQYALDRRKAWLDGFLIRKFRLPLVSWQADLEGANIDAAAYDVMVQRGYNPETSDSTLLDRFKQVERWAMAIPNNVTPMVIDSSGSVTPGTNSLTPTVTTAVQRGWSSRPTQPSSVNPVAGNFEGD